jgi:hypothetical protein
MQLRKLLEKWDLTSLKIKTPFLDMQWEPKDEDTDAAWDLYVELITRVATQRLEPDEGDEAAALKSIHDLFPSHGRRSSATGATVSISRESPC